MAVEMVSSIIRWTADKLSSLAAVSASATSSLPQHELQQLQFTMMKIQSTLDEAEERNLEYETAKLRLKELKQVAFEAEDVMEEYQTQVLYALVERKSSKMNLQKGKLQEMCDNSSIQPVSIAVPAGFVRRVRAVTERFDGITREWEDIDLWQKSGKRRRRLQAWTRVETSSHFDSSSYFCREDEKDKLIDLLLSEAEKKGNGVLVLPIVGMGGIGKTTLAQQVYSDPRVCQFFKLRGWVCVSEKFDVVGLMQKIIMSVNPNQESDHARDLEELHETLYEELHKKKLLLVLDDVWVEDSTLWECVRDALLYAKLVAVIVTTRNSSTAQMLHTMDPYTVDILSFDKGWKLFEQIALAGLDPAENGKFVDLGKKIVEKCKGLPLAIKVLAGIVQSKYDEEAWTDILESEVWELEQDEDQILPALRLSYDCMPMHLKRCFMYFSLFSKDYTFRDFEIINIWMSQGLLRPSETAQPEDIGTGYLNYFKKRSILQEVSNLKWDQLFSMHDLIHDLAQSVASDEFLRVYLSELQKVRGNVQHLSLVSNDNYLMADLSPILKSKVLRSVTVHGKLCTIHSSTNMKAFLDELFQQLKCIQSLNLTYSNINELPDSIGGLRRLRHLCLSSTDVKCLPESICDLYNLLILDLSYNLLLLELPRGIGKLFNLRQLKLQAPRVCMPSELQQLTNLQVLTDLNVGRGDWHCGIGVLKDLVNLRGELSITGLENTRSSDVSHGQACLKAKTHLASLVLNWQNTVTKCRHHGQYGHVIQEIPCPRIPAEELAMKVLECLEPPTGLACLEIQNYVGATVPRWMGDASFCDLQTMRLDSWANCKSLPPLGQLPLLRYIKIKRMESVQSVGPEFCSWETAVKGFPSLQALDFESMERWDEWSESMEGEFPQLRKLTLIDCPKLRKFPRCVSSLRQELMLSQCEALTTLGSLPFLTVLKLYGKWIPQLLSWSSLPMLQHLEIGEYVEALLLLNYQSRTSLKVLKLIYCDNLRSIVAPKILTCLEVLKANYCPHLQLSPDEHIPLTIKLKAKGSPQIWNWQENRVTRQAYEQSFSNDEAVKTEECKQDE